MAKIDISVKILRYLPGKDEKPRRTGRSGDPLHYAGMKALIGSDGRRRLDQFL